MLQGTFFLPILINGFCNKQKKGSLLSKHLIHFPNYATVNMLNKICLLCKPSFQFILHSLLLWNMVIIGFNF